VIEKEEREKDKRFNDWLSYSVREVEKEKRRNHSLQVSSPPSWIHDLPEFKVWLDPNTADRNTLWLSGTTGFGKSVIAAYAIKQLARKFPSAPVIFFFCKDNEFLGQAHQIMRTFLYQTSVGSAKTRIRVKQIW
jgi:DNA replication protein DnaC